MTLIPRSEGIEERVKVTYADAISHRLESLPKINAQAGTALGTEHLVLLLGVELVDSVPRLAVAMPLDVRLKGVYHSFICLFSSSVPSNSLVRNTYK
jgi:hypothetical protein